MIGIRGHPALAVVDMPFSFVGDILFLPYDAARGSSEVKTNSLAVAPMSKKSPNHCAQPTAAWPQVSCPRVSPPVAGAKRSTGKNLREPLS